MTDALQHRRCVEPTIVDRHWSRLAPLPRGHQGSEQTASTSLQKLDLSLGSVVLCYPQFFPGTGARLEQLQSVLQRRDLCQSLRGVAHHAGHVFRMEVAEPHQSREANRNGSRDGYLSSGEA